jgi:crotonobetainyl-CoA:carnitine CoA-transferase CaiB-like acyl-CoA transferase
LRTARRQHWMTHLTAVGVPCGSVRNCKELFDDPQMTARQMLVHLEHATIGQMKVLGMPVKLSETPGALRAAPPTLGAHTDLVLERDLGLQKPDIDRLRALKVV